MLRFHSKNKVVSPEKFDALFEKDANIATFLSNAEEEAYVARDERLIERIFALINEFDSNAIRGGTVHIIEDWWPNHTRYLEIAYRPNTNKLLSSLQNLLTGEFSDYRIQVCVYSDISDGSSNIGSVVLYQKRLVIENNLNELLSSEIRRG